MGWAGPMTRRQYLAWQAWLEEEWNRPSRTDHYLMQNAAMQASKKVTLNDLKIPFTSKQTSVSPEHKKTMAELAKQAWIVRVQVNSPNPIPVTGWEPKTAKG